VLPIVKNLLSHEGRAAADHRTNSLIIIDRNESIEKIQKFLSAFDKPVKQVRIRLKFHETISSEGRSISADGRVSGKKWSISKGKRKKDGVDIRLQDRKRTQQGTSQYFIQVASGSWAYILVGKDIPYRQRWISLCRRYAGCSDSVIFQKIETGMEVKPVISGNLANVEIIPRISHEVGRGKRGVIRFARASTRLSVPLGQWITISGTDQKNHEVIRAILESGTGKKSSTLSISLLLETL